MRRATSRWIRLALGRLSAVLLVCLVGAGDPAAEAPPYPPLGKRVDIGGYRLHLHCTGTGSPTVVLEAGAGDFSFDWGLVQPEVARFTRVCSYDRAGSVWSDPGPTPRTMKQEVHELHTLLRKAGIKGPYVLVGHSYGGLLARLYARQYRREVVGMVLVDSTDPDTTLGFQGKLVRIREGAKGRPVPPVQTMKSSPPGPLSDEQRKQFEEFRKFLGTPRISAPYDQLPADLQKLHMWARFHPQPEAGNPFWPEELQEMYLETQRQPHPLGDIPLMVLTGGKKGGGPPPGISAEEWQRLSEEKRRQKEAQARLSRSGKFVLAERSGHHIHLDQPALVIDAIRQVVAAARKQTRLAQPAESRLGRGSNGAMGTQPPESDAPPPLGKLYEVGGHKMHLYQTGNGSRGPAVVLEAGAGAFSLDWYLVQQEVAKFARVCSYDRAGHAWSELGPRPRTMKQAAYNLRRLLAKAGVRGPYVMVGHSLGGALVRVFATDYPNEVAGIVLVDSGIENNPVFINGKLLRAWDEAKPRQIPPPRDQILNDERILSEPELEGYKKFREWLGAPKIEGPFNRLPEPIQKLRLWAMSLPQSNVTDHNPYAAEESLLLFADRIRMKHPLGNKPLVVLTRKSDEQGRIEGQKELRNLSSNSAFAESDFPVHEIQLAQPDLVVDAVRAVLKSHKTGGKLKLPDSDLRP